MIHRHKWVARAATSGDYFTTINGVRVSTKPSGQFTRVLYTCSVCLKAKTEEYEGTWELSKFL